MQISKSTFQFLKDIRDNNSRPWFEENKPRFMEVKEEFKGFVQAVNDEMDKHDHIEKAKIFRIYRDVRFSKDKTPYKSNISVGFTRATQRLRGGYYLQIEPNNCFVGGGFWAPDSKDLRRIRDEFAASDDEIRTIINDKKFIEHFGELTGEGVKTAPKGFDKTHKAIDLIRKKQFIIYEEFTQKDVLSKDFYKKVDASFRAMRPFFDYMSDVLTTNLNGESLID